MLRCSSGASCAAAIGPSLIAVLGGGILSAPPFGPLLTVVLVPPLPWLRAIPFATLLGGPKRKALPRLILRWRRRRVPLLLGAGP